MGAINTTQHQICVASRPEPVFQNKFSVESTLYLHDLTQYDMQRFVASRLSKLDEVVRNQLSKDIPEKAQGIFLWTHQVVLQEIREDWEVTQDVDVEILDRFPAGLRPLLDRTVATIPERYRQQAYLTFLMINLMMDLEITFTSLQYSFLDDYCRDLSFAYTMAVTDWRKIETEDERLQS